MKKIPISAKKESSAPSRLEFKYPEFRQRVTALFDRVERDADFRAAFVQDPTGTIMEDVYRRPLERQRVSDANRLLFSLIASKPFRDWIRTYARAQRGKAVSRDRFSHDFADAVVKFGDPNVTLSLTLAAAHATLPGPNAEYAKVYGWVVYQVATESRGCAVYNQSYAWTENATQSSSATSSTSDSRSDADSGSASQSDAGAVSDSRSDSQSDSQTDSQADSESDIGVASDSESDAGSESDSEASTDVAVEGGEGFPGEISVSGVERPSYQLSEQIVEQLIFNAQALAKRGALQNPGFIR